MDELVFKGLLGGIGIALVCGPFGCLMVWQKMSYFGAALAHSALLGVALGLFFELNLQASIGGICVLVSMILMLMERYANTHSDTALGIIAHSTLAGGIILLSVMPSLRINLMSYLFGDILSIRWRDLYWILIGGGLTLLVLTKIWRPLLSLIINRNLALVDGVREQQIRLIFLVLLSLVVAIAMQIVGILLVVSLLIIPASIASRLAKSPEQMALISSIVGALCVALGMLASLLWDTPTGPTIVIISSLGYLLSLSRKTHQISA